MRILTLMTLDVFRLSLGWALESLGHQVYHLTEIREDLLDEAWHTFRPELLMDMGWDVEQCDPKKRALLRNFLERHHIFHVYFAEEDWLHYDRWSKRYVGWLKPQFVLTRAPQCVVLYQAMNIASAYFDVGCNPDFQRPMPYDEGLAADVSVVVNGQFNWDIYRRKSISDLVVPLFDQPYRTKIWGRDWKTTETYFGTSPPPEFLQGRLDFSLTPTVYSSCKINISVQSVQDQISNRTYDILSSGGFLLTSNTDAVREKLRPGMECAVSDSPEETLEKVAYYLEHDEERERIARNGMLLAREKFAYQKTLPVVWPKIEKSFALHRRMKTR